MTNYTKGQRVRFSERGIAHFMSRSNTRKSSTGIVDRNPNADNIWANMVPVKFDGRKHTILIHRAFIELDPTSNQPS